MTANELKQWRTAHNLTQQRLAEMLDTPKRTIENWEGGTRTPPKYLRRALADIARELGSVAAEPGAAPDPAQSRSAG